MACSAGGVLPYAVVLFVLALVATFIGLSSVAVFASGIAKILVFVLLVTAVASLLLGRRSSV